MGAVPVDFDSWSPIIRQLDNPALAKKLQDFWLRRIRRQPGDIYTRVLLQIKPIGLQQEM